VPYGGRMQVIVGASQADIVRLPRSAELDEVGPTSASGWTAVWCETLEPLAPLGKFVAVDEGWTDETAEERLWLRVVVDGTSSIWDWSDHSATEAEVRTAAQALCHAFVAPEPDDALIVSLATAIADEELMAGLDELFDPPELDEEDVRQRRTLVAHRGDLVGAHVAARIAAGEIGPLDAADLEDSWVLLRPENAVDADRLAFAVTDGTSRRSLTVALWRGAGDACGVWVIDRYGSRVPASWNTRWWRPAGPDLQQRDTAARALAGAVGSDVDQLALSDLARSRANARDPLAELASLLSLPQDALAVLDDGPAAPTLKDVEPATWWRASWDAVRPPTLGASPDTPHWAGIGTLVAVLAIMLVMLALTVVVAGTLITDGSLVEQDGVTRAAWAFGGFSALLLAFYAWLSTWLIRRNLRDREVRR